jgi:photosystem II PsbM protein
VLRSLSARARVRRWAIEADIRFLPPPAVLFALAAIVAVAQAFAPAGVAMRPASKLAASKLNAAPQMSMEMTTLEQMTNTMAGVVAVDGGTVGLDVSFGAFLAVILGLFIPVVFLVTLYIQSDAQGTASTFRNPDSTGGQLFEDM